MSSKLTFYLLIIVVFLYTFTSAKDNLSQSFSVDEINQNTTVKPIEFNGNLFIDAMKKFEMIEKIENTNELEMDGKIGNGRMENYQTENNLTSWLKIIIRDLIVELEKQSNVKESAHDAVGDFWTSFTDAVKSINNYANLLLSKISEIFQPPSL